MCVDNTDHSLNYYSYYGEMQSAQFHCVKPCMKIKQEKISALCRLEIKQAKDITKRGGMLPADHEIIVVTVISGLLKQCPNFSTQKLFAENTQLNF